MNMNMNMKQMFLSSVVIILFSIVCNLAFASENLFGFKSNESDFIIVKIDPTTGVETPTGCQFGPPPFGGSNSAFDTVNHRYFFAARFGDPINPHKRIYTCNTISGQISISGEVPTYTDYLEFDPITQTLFGITSNDPGAQNEMFVKIDTITGQLTPTGFQTPGPLVGASALDAVNHHYFLLGYIPNQNQGGGLFVIDTQTGQLVANYPQIPGSDDLEFDPINHVLLSLNESANTSNVTIIDPSTGTLTPTGIQIAGPISSKNPSALDAVNHEYFIAGHEPSLLAFDTLTGNPIANPQADSDVALLEFDPNNKPVCVNGKVEAGEECAVVAKLSVCGNGVVEAGEQCDNGTNNRNTVANACRTNCKKAHCGDKVIDAGEECDDGNLTIGDGCSSLCKKDSGALKLPVQLLKTPTPTPTIAPKTR